MIGIILKDIENKEKTIMDCLRNWDENGARKYSDENHKIFENNPHLCQFRIELYATHLINRFAIFWNVSEFDKCKEIIAQLDKLPLSGYYLIKKLQDKAELEFTTANYPQALSLIESAMQYDCPLEMKFELLLLKGKVEHEIIGIPFKVNAFSEALGVGRPDSYSKSI